MHDVRDNKQLVSDLRVRQYDGNPVIELLCERLLDMEDIVQETLSDMNEHSTAIRLTDASAMAERTRALDAIRVIAQQTSSLFESINKLHAG